jgi:hypothetical protein
MEHLSSDQMQIRQDELAELFSHHMNLQNPTPPPQTVTQPIAEPQIRASSEPPPTAAAAQPVQQQQQQQQPIVYASSHYYHVAHIVAPKPPPTPTPSDEELIEMLTRNWIDPASLQPAQANLFRNADHDQRLRLLELWRISPPSGNASALADTSLAQEEQMARERYERMMHERGTDPHFDTHIQPDTTAFARDDDNMVTSDSAAAMATSSLLSSHHVPGSPDSHRQAEPYILSGYEQLAKREYNDSIAAADAATRSLRESTSGYNQAIDPVYNGPLWEKRADGIQDMENRYGNFAAMREYGVCDHDMMM